MESYESYDFVLLLPKGILSGVFRRSSVLAAPRSVSSKKVEWTAVVSQGISIRQLLQAPDDAPGVTHLGWPHMACCFHYNLCS